MKTTFPLSDEDPQRAVERLLAQFRRRLSQERAQGVLQKNNVIEFNGGYLRFWAPSWYILASIDKGQVEVSAKGNQVVIAYHLSFSQQLMLNGFISLLVLFFFGKNFPVMAIWVAFFILMLLDFVLGMLQFSKFVQSVWAEAHNLPLPDVQISHP